MIRLENVSVSVGESALLEPVSMQIDEGAAAAIHGPNGSGKSTLLRVLVGMQKPTAGVVTVAGKTPTQKCASFRRDAAAMIGLPPLASDLTVQDHVALVRATWGLLKPVKKQSSTHEVFTEQSSVETFLDELQIADLAHRYPHELSSGQVQLLGLTMVLARPFRLLVLDEPEQRLDADKVQLVCRALKRRLDEGATVVVATHSDVLSSMMKSQRLLLKTAV
ncbi:ABC transporter ATP-binding protein [Timonella sp. A28]|uniref:ABC transporter ATP-binding protein n=1 Tax=Timonella sp. A28 TaxID=3442640 RepID=UPI003EB9F5DB